MTSDVQRPSAARTAVLALIGVAEIVALAVAQLVWLDRADRINDVAGIMGGPLIGVLIGGQIAARRDRKRAVKRRPLWWHVIIFAALSLAWLVFVAGAYGGLDAEVVPPTVVLTAVGSVVMTLVAWGTSPESFRP